MINAFVFIFFLLIWYELRHFCPGNLIFSPVCCLLVKCTFFLCLPLFWLLFNRVFTIALSVGSWDKATDFIDSLEIGKTKLFAPRKNRQMHFNSKKICAVHDESRRRRRRRRRRPPKNIANQSKIWACFISGPIHQKGKLFCLSYVFMYNVIYGMGIYYCCLSHFEKWCAVHSVLWGPFLFYSGI